MSSVAPLWIIQTQRGIGFRTSWLDFMPALGAIRPPPWEGIWLEYLSALLQQSLGSQQQSAESAEKRWSSRDAELFICKRQCAEVRYCQHGPVSHD